MRRIVDEKDPVSLDIAPSLIHHGTDRVAASPTALTRGPADPVVHLFTTVYPSKVKNPGQRYIDEKNERSTS